MSRFTQYLQDTRREMAHVSWPTRTQTIAFTLTVVAISIFVAVYLSLFDVLFARGLEFAFEHAPRFSQFQTESATTSPVQINIATTTGDLDNIKITPLPLEE